MADGSAHPDAALLRAVARSPAAAAAHDREAWVGLFSADGRIEDPVGSRPHVGTAAIARFYDTFIGPRDVTFLPGTDLVAGRTVVRDLDLQVGMSRDVTLHVPAYLRYDLDDTLAITRLRAHWELPAMLGRFLRLGGAAAPAGARLATGLLRHQGPAGALGFATGLRRVGARGRQRVHRLLADARAGDEVAVRRALGDRTVITSGDGTPIPTTGLVALLRDARWEKVIAAGDTVTARIHAGDRRGVLFTTVHPKPFAITEVTLFFQPGRVSGGVH